MPAGTLSTVDGTFEWIVPRESLASKDVMIRSPEFRLLNSRWSLELYFTSDEWIGVDLWKIDHVTTKDIMYNIKINGRTDVKEITNISHFTNEPCYSGGPIILEKDLTSNSNIIITCHIKRETPHLISGKEFVTCAVQTEIANSVIEKDNPKDDNWLLLDIKDDTLLRERMKELLTKDSDYDATICVQEKEFRAHRNILRTRSPVFAMMLSHDTKERNTGTISIEDCDPESFEEFLLYVYTGRTDNLTPTTAVRLYYPADKYDFPVLKERCVSLLKASLSVESICDIVLLAAKHQEKELLRVATEFFARNMKKIVVTVSWQKFMSQNPVEANELIIKCSEILQPED